MTETAFTHAGIPDPEQDFEGCLQALADRYIAAVEDLTPAERETYRLHSSAERLASLIRIKAPDILVDREERVLMRRLRKRRSARAAAR